MPEEAIFMQHSLPLLKSYQVFVCQMFGEIVETNLHLSHLKS